MDLKIALALPLLVPALAFCATRSSGAAASPPAPAEVLFSSAPTTLLVSLAEVNGELAEEDPAPMVRIYGDGTVRVHRPDYVRYPGDYELRLDDAELRRLLALVAAAVTGFEPRTVQYRIREAETARHLEALSAGRSPVLYAVEDDSITVLELHLLGYGPAGGTRTSGEVHRGIRWLGLRTDAARFPHIEPLQRLLAAEEDLRALTERNDLRRTSR